MATLIAARRYSLSEVDALREIITQVLTEVRSEPVVYAFNASNDFDDFDRPIEYREVTIEPTKEFVESQVRTAMMAGIEASEYIKRIDAS